MSTKTHNTPGRSWFSFDGSNYLAGHDAESIWFHDHVISSTDNPKPTWCKKNNQTGLEIASWSKQNHDTNFNKSKIVWKGTYIKCLVVHSMFNKFANMMNENLKQKHLKIAQHCHKKQGLQSGHCWRCCCCCCDYPSSSSGWRCDANGNSGSCPQPN